MVEVSFYSGDGYNGNMDLMGPAGLKNGDKVSLSDPFCRVCKPGTYKDFYIDNCYKNENEAFYSPDIKRDLTLGEQLLP